MKLRVALILMLLPILAIANPKSSIFHKGDFETVKAKAANEGKLFFLDFYADYCYACKLMDETTFIDQRVKDYIEDTYIPYKVDIIDFDGINLKNKYKIKVLPTILVFNSQGELVGRYEQMLGPTRIINELKKYDLPKNRIKNGNFLPKEEILANTAPTKPIIPIPNKTAAPTEKPTSYNNSITSKIQSIRPATTNDARINGHQAIVDPTPPTKNNDNSVSSDEDDIYGYTSPKKTNKKIEIKPQQEAPKEEEKEEIPLPKPVIKNKKTTFEAPTSNKRYNISPSAKFIKQTNSPEVQPPSSEGLFQFTVKKFPTDGFGVQIGVFAEYGNVLREVQKLQGKFNQPILVNISTLHSKVVYKVIVGAFDSNREAVSFRRMMQKKGADGVIKDLSSVKL